MYRREIPKMTEGGSEGKKKKGGSSLSASGDMVEKV